VPRTAAGRPNAAADGPAALPLAAIEPRLVQPTRCPARREDEVTMHVRSDEIAQAYRQTFGQESVLRVVTTACVSF
jgi:hypothetical protein